jgi:Uma2 family endonuclease
MGATETSLPTLENGDNMDREEFHRRYSLRPDLHGVELIEGIVYVPWATKVPKDLRSADAAVPVLENGDRMNREEFHRRYSLRPDLHGVELIQGVVYMPSPTKARDHGRPQQLILTWLGVYESRHPDVQSNAPSTIMMDEENEPEPDAMLVRSERGLIGDDGYLHGAPDLVVEVANSTVSRDLHQKKDAYERSGVREYVVWRVQDEAIDWFELDSGRYVARQPDADGVIESRWFPGLRMDINRALAGDLAGVLAAVR